MSARFDISDVFAGENKNIRISCVDAAGQPYNLTGKTLVWTLREGVFGPVKLTKSGGAITLANGAGTNDVAIVEIEAGDLVDALTGEFVMRPGRYIHALKQTDAGDEAILSEGDFTFGGAAAR